MSNYRVIPRVMQKDHSKRDRDECGYCSYLYPDGTGKCSHIGLGWLVAVLLARCLGLSVLATERSCETWLYWTFDRDHVCGEG
jgi:hypothetical protein